MSSPSLDPESANVLDGLEVLDELGRGALSSVFRARRNGAEYAVKVQRHPSADLQSLRAFHREAAVLAHLHHPGLVEIHAVGEHDGLPHLVMELIDGRTLQAVIDAARGPLPETQVLSFAIDCAGALATAHRAGVVHRDIKPANIIVQPDQRAKLIDFGLVTQAGEQQSADVAIGTLRYSPPEQTGMLKRPVDGRSDLYSFGVVLYEALAGHAPFEVEDVGEMVRLHAVAAPDLTLLPSTLSPALVRLVGRLLAKDPDDRYQTGEGVVADLQRIAASPGIADFDIGHDDDPRTVIHDLPLAGRSRELGELLERWHETTRGHGCVVVIHGHPGEGKSRLVRELQRKATAGDEIVLSGKAVRHDPAPLAPLREAIERHLDWAARQPADRAPELQRRIRDAAAEAGGEIDALSPRLAELLGPGGQRGDHEQYFTAVAAFFVALAAQHHGGLLAIDDAQWLDPATRRVLELMTADLPTSPLLVALTARRDEDSAVAVDQLLTRLAGAVRAEITLTPLDETATGSLVREQLGGIAVADAFVAQLHNRSAGNPFAAVEYLRAILHAGLIRPSWGHLMVDQRGLDDLHLPDDVVDLVLERVGRLGDEARALLTAGSAMGTRFAPSVAASALQIDARGAELAIADALRERLVERTGHDECGFVHDRIREALLEPLSDVDQQALHQLLAEALERVDSDESDHIFAIAHHFSAGQRTRTPAKVLEWSTRAGRAALAGYANEHAATLFGTAADAARQLGAALDANFHEDWAQALLGVGDSRSAGTCIDAVLATSTDRQQRGRVLLARAESRNGMFDPDGGATDARRGLDEIGAAVSDGPIRSVIAAMRGLGGGIVAVLRRKGRAAPSAEDARSLDLEIDLLLTLGFAYYLQMRPLALLNVLFRALPLAGKRGASPATGRVVGELAVVAGTLGIEPLRRRLSASAIDMAEGSGDRRALAHATLYTFLSLEAAGRTREAGVLATGLIQQHGRWLRLGDLLTGVSAVAFNLDLRGYSREAMREWHAAHERARHASEASENPYLLMGWVSLEILGERAEAARLRESARALGERSAGERFRRQTYLSAVIRYLRDQGEYGDELRGAVAESEALGLSPLTASVWLQSNFSQPLRMWLEIAQRTEGAQRAAALKEARRRRRRMRFIRFVPLLNVYNLAAYASMAQIQGKPKRALKLAGKAEALAIKLDTPFLHYEVARVRARVANDLGDEPEHRRQAREAMRHAVDGGWATRVEALRKEFGAAAGMGVRVGRSEQEGPSSSRASRHRGAGRGLPSARSTTSSSTRGSLPVQHSSTTNVGGSLRGQRSLDALLALSLAASQTHDPRELAKVGLDQIIGLLGAERAFLFLAEDGATKLTLSAARSADGQSLLHETTFARTIVQRVQDDGAPLVVSGSDEAGAMGSSSAVQHGLRSIIAAPLQLEGRLLGVVYLDSRLARGIFTAEDVDILSAISTQIAIAIETARAGLLELAVATEREQRDLAEALRVAGEEISETLDPVRVLDRTLHAAGRVIPFDRAAALVIDARTARWTLAASAGGLDHQAAAAAIEMQVADGFLEALTAQSGPQGRARVLPGSAPVSAVLSDAESWLCVPLVARGELCGAMLMGSSDPGSLGDAQVELAATFAGQGTVAYENALLFKAVEQMATTDELTQVNNRRHFFSLSEPQFDTARRYDVALAALMLDIDHFKRVNDTFGHAAGDDVIRTVAQRLATLIRTVDIIGRYGGEEFALLLPCTGAEARVLAERLRETVAATPIETCAGPISVTISVGVAIVERADDTLAATLSRADTALYEAKSDGRNCVRVHTGHQTS